MENENVESILRNVEYKKFLDLIKNTKKYESINLDTFAIYSVAEIGKRQIGLFNELLLYASKAKGIDIFSVLVEITKHIIDANKLKNLINPDVKWLLAEILKSHNNYTEDSTLNLFM